MGESSEESSDRGGPQRDSSEPARASASTLSSRDAEAEGDGSDSHSGTFPNPINFAERVMHILENEIAPSAIWWADNQSIALHPEQAKNTGLLANHFHASRFSTFVRTLLRW